MEGYSVNYTQEIIRTARSPGAVETHGVIISFNENFDLGIWRRNSNDDSISSYSTDSMKGKPILQAAASYAFSDSSAVFEPNLALYLAFGTLSIVGLAASLDATSISPALPIIADKLKGSAIQAFWAATSFRLTATVFQPSYACFAVILGRKSMILVALIFFTAGAIVAAIADDFVILLLGRTLQGMGAGGISILTEIIVTDLVPLRVRGVWFGFIGGAVAIGTSVGPVIGGALVDNLSWRWIFWINVPLCSVALVLIPAFLKIPFKQLPIGKQLRRVDWIGTVVFIGSITALLIPISWGGVLYPWSSWKVLVPLVASLVGLLGFVLYEKYAAVNPFINLRIFGNRTASITYLSNFLHGTILWTLIYYLPIYYETVKGMTPTQAGIAVFPETFTVAPASLIMGIIVSRTGHYRWGVWGGWLLTTLGMGLLCLLDVNTSTSCWVILNLVGGLGMGSLFSAMAFAIQASACATGEDMGFAISMFTFFRALGTAIGVAISGTIFQNSLKAKLLSYSELAPYADAYSLNAEDLIVLIKTITESQMRMDIMQAYADGLKLVWAVMCGVASIGLVLTFFTREYDLDGPKTLGDELRHSPDVEDESDKRSISSSSYS